MCRLEETQAHAKVRRVLPSDLVRKSVVAIALGPAGQKTQSVHDRAMLAVVGTVLRLYVSA